jgi:tRNA pseudouridine55 synthase
MPERAGVLPVDKPVGPTSHDIVAVARRALHIRRIGHTGTLDPFASGLLLLCVGSATRITSLVSPLGKTYVARMRLGAGTDTDDSTGTVLEESDGWMRITGADVQRALAGQVGDIEQVPPLYSAKKVNGERAYRLARAGRATELAPVRVRIDAIRLTAWEPPDADFEITCGSGTYIRSVARDAGRQLGTGAHLTRLRRTRIDRFRVEQALAPERLADPDAVAGAWIEPLDALAHVLRVELSPEETAVIANGGTVAAPRSAADANPVVLATAGRLVAIGEIRDGRLLPRKVLA